MGVLPIIGLTLLKILMDLLSVMIF